MRLPIAMTTYERLSYFRDTMASLRACGEDISLLTIYDDASPSEEKRSALGGCGARVIIAAENAGPYRSCVNAISAAWDGHDSEYLIYTQDDVEFSHGCFRGVLDAADAMRRDGHRIGILSLYHRARKIRPEAYTAMPVGHPGAICWLVARDFWRDFVAHGVERPCTFPPNDERKRHFVRDLADYKICRWAQLQKYAVAYTRLSLVQHMGDRSSLSERDMSFCRSPNYVGVLNGQEN